MQTCVRTRRQLLRAIDVLPLVRARHVRISCRAGGSSAVYREKLAAYGGVPRRQSSAKAAIFPSSATTTADASSIPTDRDCVSHALRWRSHRLVGQSTYFDYNREDLAEIALWWFGPERCVSGLADGAGAIFDASSRTLALSSCAAVPWSHSSMPDPFGPGGAGHSHSDTLSLVVTVGEQECSSTPAPSATWIRSGAGTSEAPPPITRIRIDGHDQGVAAGPFRWAKKPEVNFCSTLPRPQIGNSAVGQCTYQGLHPHPLRRVRRRRVLDHR